MEFEDPEEDNFLDRFRAASSIVDFSPVDEDEVLEFDGHAASSSSTAPVKRAGEMALPASWIKPRCKECDQEDGEEGGGRYGTDDHEGLFFCGRCWKAWDEAEKAKIMKPLWQQRLLKRPEDADNFLNHFGGAVGTDDIDGAWDPSSAPKRRDGELALPGSWERPICFECGNDEGDIGGGRYGHGEKAGKFFCFRCWQSWDEADRRGMMMAYAPSNRFCDGPTPMDPIVLCPAPEAPPLDDDFFDFDDDFGGPDSGDDVFGEDQVQFMPEIGQSSSSAAGASSSSEIPRPSK